MSFKTRWLVPITSLLACGAGACTATVDRPATAAVAPVECPAATLDSAAAVASYAACDSVEGDLRIVGTDLSDLTALQRLRSVSGTLEISSNPELETLSGLERLSSVQGLEIRGNIALSSLRGLEGLERMERLVIERNGLHDTAGLSNLRQVGDLAVVGNAKLISLHGLRHVSQARTVRVQHNPLLCGHFGLLPELKSVDRLIIRSNRGLSRRDVESLVGRFKKPLEPGELEIPEPAREASLR
jgi:hypothetical protein